MQDDQPPDGHRKLSARERAKADRRGRIVRAASGALREAGFEALSVKMIAERAGVSAATVYNLFGTKGAVLERVYELGLAQFQRRMATIASRDSIEKIFDSVTLTMAVYRTDLAFYRAIIRRGDGGRDRRLSMATHRLRAAYWTGVLKDAIAEGHLAPRTDPDRLSILIVQAATGALTLWAADLISIDELDREMQFALAAVLWPFASAGAGGKMRLEARMRSLGTAPLRLAS
jgi:AcrR family transcriptional regulator